MTYRGFGLWLWVAGVGYAGVGCAGSASSNPEPSAPGKVVVDADAKTVTVRGLRVTRPEGWEFVTADASLGQQTELMMVGPATGEYRASLRFSRRLLQAGQRTVEPEAFIELFGTAAAQLLESSTLEAQPVYREIAGQPGAYVSFRAEPISLADNGATVEMDGRVYGFVTDREFWTMTGFVPADGEISELDAIIASLRY